MSDGFTLTRDELRELSGLTNKGAIARWLTRQGYPYEPGAADGWPRVLRSFVQVKLGGIIAPPTREPRLHLVTSRK